MTPNLFRELARVAKADAEAKLGDVEYLLKLAEEYERQAHEAESELKTEQEGSKS